MNEPAVMSRRVLAWLIAVGVAAFGGALTLVVVAGDVTPGDAAGAHSFSRSAIGHRAFVETLRRLDIPVLVSRHDSAGRAGRRAMLVLLEPRPEHFSPVVLARDLVRVANVLLVLPKWQGEPRRDRPDWLATADLVPLDRLDPVLRTLGADITVRRPGVPVTFPPTQFGTPTIGTAPQLLDSDDLRPVVATAEGILVGELRQGGARVFVLADPDILSNHGIGQGDNAAFTVALIEFLLGAVDGVVIDETIHGFRREPSLWRTLFEFPLIVVTILTGATVAALLWSATGRFGAPVPLPPVLAPGKAGLIDNSARLLRHGGHGAAMLERYLRVSLRDVARRLHAPPGIGEAELDGWLDDRRRRAALGGAGELRQAAAVATRGAGRDEGRLVRVARDIHRWKREMLDGGGQRP